eukprot:gene16908-8939_t
MPTASREDSAAAAAPAARAPPPPPHGGASSRTAPQHDQWPTMIVPPGCVQRGAPADPS